MTTVKHSSTLEMLMKYKIWADEITYKCILELPNHELPFLVAAPPVWLH